jgi:hypothetical protein
VDDGIGANKTANLVADAHAPILYHNVALRDTDVGVGQEPANRDQQPTQVFVDGIGIETIGDDDLHLRRVVPRQRSESTCFFRPQALSGRRVCEIVVAIRCGRTNAHAARAGVSDDAGIDAGIERSPRVRVDGVKARVGGRRVLDAEIETPLAKFPEKPSPFFFERDLGSSIAACFAIGRVELATTSGRR